MNPAVKCFAAALAAAAALHAGSSSAQLLEVSGGNQGSFIGSGQTLSGVFDMSSSFAGRTATAGYVTARFRDDGDRVFQTTVIRSDYAEVRRVVYDANPDLCSANTLGCLSNPFAPGSFMDRYLERSALNVYADEADAMNIRFGALTRTAMSNHAPSYGATTSSPDGQRWTGWGYDYFTTNYTDFFSAYTGDFSTVIALDEVALAQFNTSGGRLAFNIDSAFNGSGLSDAYLLDITLTVDTVSAVPEPETYAMMLAGLGLLGWHARRRKQRGSNDTRAPLGTPR